MNIEFCGLPGCGKSFITNKLIETIPNCYKIYRLSSGEIKNTYITRKVLGLRRRIRIVSPKISKIKESLDMYVYGHDIGSRTSTFYRILLEEILELLVKHEKYDLIFGNEGVVQSLSSLSHDSLIDSDFDSSLEVIDNYFYKKVETVILYCYVERRTNIDRILSRNRAGDRFLDSDINTINKQLDIKEYNIKYILNKLNNVHVVKIDLDNSEAAVKSIASAIREYGYEFYK